MVSADYDAARRRFGLIDRSDRGRLVVSGRDRASYLQGLLTNDITALKTGEGCYAAYLTAQGRMITDLWVYELGDVMLLSLGRDLKDLVLGRLDQFVFSEDVQLGDVTDTFASTAIVGPESAAVVESMLDGVSGLVALGEHGNLRAQWSGEPVVILRVTDLGEPGFELLASPPATARLMGALHQRGAVDVSEATAEAIRIEAGVPKFHRDMDEETIPLEAGIESRAISLTKGCYVGQEVIIRVLHRGHGRVARRLVGMRGEAGGERRVPSSGAAVSADGKQVGHITSAAWSPSFDCAIALGYVHRDFTNPGTALDVEGTPVVVSPLPFA